MAWMGDNVRDKSRDAVKRGANPRPCRWRIEISPSRRGIGPSRGCSDRRQLPLRLGKDLQTCGIDRMDPRWPSFRASKLGGGCDSDAGHGVLDLVLIYNEASHA